MAIVKGQKQKGIEEVVRNVIHKELVGVENRLMTKIEDTSINFKEYVDTRISQVQHQMKQQFGEVQQQFGEVQQQFGDIKTDIKKLDKKIDARTDGIVQLIETRVGEIIDLDRRVTILEKN